MHLGFIDLLVHFKCGLLNVLRGETAIGNFAELLERRERWLRMKRKMERRKLKKLKKTRTMVGPPKAEKKDPVDAVTKASAWCSWSQAGPVRDTSADLEL